jgi:hypothetical protein
LCVIARASSPDVVHLSLLWPALSEIVKSHKFVGVVDYDLSLSLLQHSTRLYLVDHAALA